jgi:hypothetical protein
MMFREVETIDADEVETIDAAEFGAFVVGSGRFGEAGAFHGTYSR